MRLLKKVPTIEVKRCFVTAQLVKVYGGKKGKLGKISRTEFKRALARAKSHALRMTEKQLDTYIAHEWKGRLTAYNASDWYLATVHTREVGVWKRAAGLPLAWTNGSLKETAALVKNIALKTNLSRTRAKRAVLSMTETNVGDLQSEKYLLPIVFKGGTGTKGRKRLRNQMKGDIDDGCMRSVTLAVNGAKNLKVYFGVPKESPAK